MPCRRGCSPSLPGPVCCCAQRRCSGRHGPHRNREHSCTADTCSNPEFCIKYRPQFCPNAPTNQENPDAGSPEFGRWPRPPPFPDITTPWPPPSPHTHPLSSTPNHLQSHHSNSSLNSLFAPPACGHQQPDSTRSGSPVRGKSTARLSIGKTSLTRLDSGHNGFRTDRSRPDSGCPMRQRPASIGRPSLTLLEGIGCCQTDRSSFGGSHPSSNGAGVRCIVPEPRHLPRGSRARAQPIGRLQQARHRQGNGNGIGSESPEREGPCECRMPPAFAGFRCTGNLGGLCDCPHCDDTKINR